MVSKETIELAYLVAIQRLVPLQRAVLILRDVFDCSAKETADVLETSVPAVNSALQRARSAMKEHLPERRTEWAAGTDVTAAERELLERYVEHSETPDPYAVKRCSARTCASRCLPRRASGRAVTPWCSHGLTAAFWNRDVRIASLRRDPCQPPARRRLLRPPPGDERYSPLAIVVLRIADGAVAEIVTFDGSLFRWFGLPETL